MTSRVGQPSRDAVRGWRPRHVPEFRGQRSTGAGRQRRFQFRRPRPPHRRRDRAPRRCRCPATSGSGLVAAARQSASAATGSPSAPAPPARVMRAAWPSGAGLSMSACRSCSAHRVVHPGEAQAGPQQHHLRRGVGKSPPPRSACFRVAEIARIFLAPAQLERRARIGERCRHQRGLCRPPFAQLARATPCPAAGAPRGVRGRRRRPPACRERPPRADVPATHASARSIPAPPHQSIDTSSGCTGCASGKRRIACGFIASGLRALRIRGGAAAETRVDLRGDGVQLRGVPAVRLHARDQVGRRARLPRAKQGGRQRDLGVAIRPQLGVAARQRQGLGRRAELQEVIDRVPDARFGKGVEALGDRVPRRA